MMCDVYVVFGANNKKIDNTITQMYLCYALCYLSILRLQSIYLSIYIKA